MNNVSLRKYYLLEVAHIPQVAHMNATPETNKRSAKKNAVCSELISMNLHNTAANPGGMRQQPKTQSDWKNDLQVKTY